MNRKHLDAKKPPAGTRGFSAIALPSPLWVGDCHQPSVWRLGIDAEAPMGRPRPPLNGPSSQVHGTALVANVRPEPSRLGGRP